MTRKEKNKPKNNNAQNDASKLVDKIYEVDFFGGFYSNFWKKIFGRFRHGKSLYVILMIISLLTLLGWAIGKL